MFLEIFTKKKPHPRLIITLMVVFHPNLVTKGKTNSTLAFAQKYVLRPPTDSA